MKKIGYKGKDKKELEKVLTEKRADLSKFRFGLAGSRTKNVKEGRALRQEVARIITEINK